MANISIKHPLPFFCISAFFCAFFLWKIRPFTAYFLRLHAFFCINFAFTYIYCTKFPVTLLVSEGQATNLGTFQCILRFLREIPTVHFYRLKYTITGALRTTLFFRNFLILLFIAPLYYRNRFFLNKNIPWQVRIRTNSIVPCRPMSHSALYGRWTN